MSDEFMITYPCYFPLGKTGYCITTCNGDRCFNLLTDKDLVEKFYKQKYHNLESIEVKVHTIPDQESLIGQLRLMEQSRIEGSHDVTHIAFDVTSSGLHPRTTMKEFIEYLETQER
ncbi:hypothetical protein [Gimesia sp.]|uniref:hypothetical protein n=1 Tax=Gimesia sp. TaxID=2024833 RepID=UPI0032EEB4B7